MSIKHLADKGLEKLMSRKLFAALLASSFLYLDKIGEDNWAMIMTAYVGLQGFVDIVMKWKDKE